MKKILKLAISGLLAFSLTACGSKPKSDVNPKEKYGCDVINVYNWGEYVGEEVNKNFEQQFNVKVVYSLFGSNEEMYTKLLGGSQYDVLVPSDYMIERLMDENMLQKLDLTAIPNLVNLADGVKSLPYDPNNEYSVPYFWGTVGIVYDKTVIDPADVEKEGFDIFRNEKYNGQSIAVYDSERDAFMMAFKALGYSMNTEVEAEIEAAYQWLLDVDKKVNPAYIQDEVIDGMINGEYVLANVYSGDAAYMLSENENLAYFMPESGTNIWSDAMVIPANAKCPKLANEYINYILTYEASMDNSSTVGYPSSNKEVLEELSSEGGDYFENEAYLPRVGYAKDEVFQNNEVLKKKLSDLWIKVKNQ